MRSGFLRMASVASGFFSSSSSFFFSSSPSIFSSSGFFTSESCLARLTSEADISASGPSFFFRSVRALTLAVVDSTAVSTLVFSLFSSFLRNSGYWKRLGLALSLAWKDFGTFRSLLTPMRAVGVMARVRKLSIGYQYQCCMKRTRPVMAFWRMLPSRVVRQIVALRPAALMIPFEMMLPMRVRVSSYLSWVILLKSFFMVATLGSWASVI
mmetsp:Transcript_46934/g.62124  ORF Transcript_46934/g.62124 Transcript_46934/m.62124 type:complete len:211 (-) Transcript_46934:2117-2749(-)